MPDAPDDTPELAFDLDVRETHAAVGYAVSRWEGLEFRLSQLYSIFVGRPMVAKTMMEYGRENHVFSRRMRRLEVAGSAYFSKCPNQDRERRLNELILRTTILAERRNRIAHGIAQGAPTFCRLNREMKIFGSPVSTYRVVPPFYAIERLVDDDEAPFAYGSREIRAIASLFAEHSEAVRIFMLTIHAFA